MATLFNTKIKDTYQSLLKLEDNTILTTTTKNVTDGLGNASPLYMSTTRVGIGTNAPSVAFEVRSLNQTDVIRFKSQYAQYGYLWTGNTQIGLGSSSFGDGTGTHIVLNNIGAWIGAAGADMATAKLQVKGSGSTSATTSFLVQNSSGTAALTVRDDLYVFGGSRVYSTGNMYMDGNSGTLFSAWGQLQLQGASYVQIMNDTLRVGSQNFNFINTSFSPNNSTNSNLILNGNGSSFTNAGAGSTSVGNVLSIPIGLSTSTGNVTLNHINIDGVINTTAGTTLQRGFYYNPTLTGTVGFTHRAIETVTGNVLLGTTSGNVGIGTSSPTNKLEVVGTGRISSTLNVGGDGSTSTSFASGFIAYDTGNAYGHSLVHAQSAQLYLFANPQGFAAGGYEPSSGGLSSGNLAFMTASTTRLKILNNGNVLIGTTTDSGYKLDVNGTARVSGALTVNTSTVNNIIFSNVGTSSSSYMRWLYNPDNTNNVKTLLYIHKTGLQNGSTYIAPTAQSSNDTYAPTGNNNYVFGGGNSLSTGSSNVFIGNLSGGSVSTGSSNVFIGKGIGGNSVSTGLLNIGIAPEEMLSGDRNNTIVIGNIANGGVALDIDNAAVIGGMRINTLYVGAYKTTLPGSAYYQTNFTIASAGGSGTDIIGTSLTLAGGRGTGTGTPGNIIFSTATATTTGTTLQTLSERMRITGTGNVGVGEASPTARLQVKGSGNSSATTSLRIQNAGGVDVLKVTDDMYVTIQNTNSTECFQLLGLNNDASIKFTPSGGNSRIVLKSQSSGLILGTVANDWADVLAVSAAQTLRIGTLTPAGGGVNYYASQNGAAGYHKWFLNGVQNAQLTGAQFVLDDSGTVTPNASSILQANSTSKGFLPPRMTNAQRAAITSPAIGLMVYCTDAVEGIYVYKSTGWTFVA